ncbi:hypothetical protein MN116_001968 [Schistosoma mekongi]|uniref:Uncharacterized protein n=1 Tax=Schistosoma mekongi TaxID=38744 RepID=A0AAE1ZK75_SCHME|nr:hypothetical protein MN116_001968 [Schistosoma mekongi]
MTVCGPIYEAIQRLTINSTTLNVLHTSTSSFVCFWQERKEQIFRQLKSYLIYLSIRIIYSTLSLQNKIFGNTGEDTVNSFGEATSQNEIKSLSRNASASIDLRSQNSFNLKSNRNLQVFLCIPKNVSENVRNIQLSHSKLKDGNLSDHRNHILPDTHISSVIDGRSNNFMPLFIFCIFICFILLVSIDEFISFSDDSMFDCYILKSYLYLKHGIKNAYTKYLSIYTGLFDVSLIVQYSYGSPPI